VLRRNIGVPRVIAFANPKGGVHKTTATVLARPPSAVPAAGRGGLGRQRAARHARPAGGSARHAKTIRHLVTELSEVELYTGRR
jgi:hypothetical protein